MNGQKAAQAAQDVVKAALIGLAAALLLAAAVTLIALPFVSLSLKAALDAGKSMACVVTAVMLFILAGMLMLKGKKPEKFDTKHGWRKHFKVLGIKAVIASAAVGCVGAVSLIDLLIRIG